MAAAAPGALAEAVVASMSPGAPIGVAVHDEDLRVLAISPSLAELSAAPVEELLGRRLADVLPAERAWQVDAYPLEFEGRRLVAVVALDVTQSRAAAERLRESRALLGRVQEMAGVGSWSWDVGADSWTWSEQLLRMAELEPGSTAPDLAALLQRIEPGDAHAVREVTARALRDGEPYEVSFTMRRADGRRRTVRGRGVPVRGPDGAVVRVDGFAQDVTELARAESRQRAAAALGRLGLSGAPIEVLLPRAVGLVAEELEIEQCAIFERRRDGRLVLRARHGDGPDTPGEYPTQVAIGPPEAPFGVLAAGSGDASAFIETVATIVGGAVERRAREDRLAEQAAARRRLVAQALDAGDRARSAISEALHDGPLQDLLALGHDVSRLRPAGEEDAYHLERVQLGIGRAIQQIREVMLDLHPVVLQVGGLEPALRAVCVQQARIGGFECDVDIEPGAGGVRDQLVLSLAGELLRNAAKHARAGRVVVALRGAADGVVLEVSDDGVGIPEERLREALAEGHVGVASSRERAEAIGGRLRVGLRPDGRPGTLATALLPGKRA